MINFGRLASSRLILYVFIRNLFLIIARGGRVISPSNKDLFMKCTMAQVHGTAQVHVGGGAIVILRTRARVGVRVPLLYAAVAVQYVRASVSLIHCVRPPAVGSKR